MSLFAHTRRFTPACLSVAVCLSLMATANAQTAPAADGDDEFDTILVTARKRTESIFESPTSITSVSADDIASANISNLDDIGKYVPNLNITRYGVGNSAHASVFIRGIGLQDHIITTDPGVGVYVDGVYLGRQMGANLSLPNIERVEVLRGPQGTLYGRNTLGGAVNIITKQPGDDTTLNYTVKAGSRGRLAADVYANKAINQEWAVSASVAYTQRDGVGKAINLANPEKEIGEEQEVSGRLALKWQPSQDFSLVLALDGVDNEAGQSPYTIELTEPLDSSDITVGEFYRLSEDLLPNNPDDLATTVAGIESTSFSVWGAAATANWQLSEHLESKFIASYRSSEYEGGLDDDATALNLSEFPEEGGADQYSMELQVNATFANWDLVSGVYYFNEDGYTESGPWVFSPWNTPDGLLNDGVTPSFGDYGYFDIHQETDSYAIYANASYQLSEELTLGGGLRYSDDHKDANALFPTFAERAYREVDSDALTWDVNLSYSLAKNLNVYGQVQRGYQTGGLPPRPFGGSAQFEPFAETHATNYEIGFKGQLYAHSTLMVSAFFTDYTDLALPFSDTTSGGGFVTIVENAGKAEAKGLEIETQLQLIEGLSLKAAVGYIDAEITEVDDSVIGINKGDSLALTPKWTVSIAPSYVMELEGGASLTARADYSFRDEMQGQTAYSPYETIDSREIFGASLSYENAGGDWRLTLYGENIFNEVYDQGRLVQTGFVGVMRSNDRSEFGLKFHQVLDW